LGVGAFLMTIACWLAFFRSTDCFYDFELALDPSYETQVAALPGGSIWNLIKLPGWGVVGLTLIAWLCRSVFMAWAGRYVKAEEAKGRKPREKRSLSLIGSKVKGAQKMGGGGAGALLGAVRQMKAEQANAQLQAQRRSSDAEKTAAAQAMKGSSAAGLLAMAARQSTEQKLSAAADARAERKLARQSVSFEGDAPASGAAEPAAEAAPPESEGAAADGGGGAEPPMQPLEC